MDRPPFAVELELPGWDLLWARLEAPQAPDAATAAGALARLRAQATLRARAAFDVGRLGEQPVVAALRALFRAAGCDPGRYRPSSEALLRRLLKGEELPEIHPLVDFNNCLSVELAVPSCVVAADRFAPPIVLRAGRAGESFDSLRGPLNLEGKPLLADPEGPFGTPITDSRRVKIRPETRRAWLVAYLPRGPLGRVSPETAAARLRELEEEAGRAVRIGSVSASAG